MKPFAQASYLAQVRRLSVLARSALRQYPIRVDTIKFINHGENTTFKVTATNGDRFLLRIHRRDYHTPAAIQEELAWLARLAKMDTLTVPRPLCSKSGKLLVTAEAAGIPEFRHCCVFHWIDGTFIDKSLSPQHMFELGKIIARLQSSAPRSQARKYWHAEGLLGRQAKFGSIDSLSGIAPKDQRTITVARLRILRKLKAFERRFPQRMGLIHADLHFGNILRLESGLGIIDFDDSGFGFHAYDLAIPLISASYTFAKKGRKNLPALREALISGYKALAPWDKHDDEILSDLLLTRRLVMIGWLNSRADNPRLKKYLKGSVRRTLKHLRSA